MPTDLSVNLNAIAHLRNRRDLPWPSVTGMGRIALKAGAAGLTIHPRPDQRHIRYSDVSELQAMLYAEFPDKEFNIEGYPTNHFLELVLNAKPQQVTLVPDEPSQATSDHGWNFKTKHNELTPIVERLKTHGIRVCLFSDPNPDQVQWAAGTGCDRLELYTGLYGATYDDSDAAKIEIEKLGQTADAATAQGLELNAGHDLTVLNLPPLLSRVPSIAEVSIGHGLTAEALEHGMEGAVKRYLAACGAVQLAK